MRGGKTEALDSISILGIIRKLIVGRSKANKHISFKHFLDLMRLIYAVFILFLALMTSAQCQQTAEDWFNKGNDFQTRGFYDLAIKAYDEVISDRSQRCHSLVQQRPCSLSQGKYDEAIKAYDEAIR